MYQITLYINENNVTDPRRSTASRDLLFTNKQRTPTMKKRLPLIITCVVLAAAIITCGIIFNPFISDASKHIEMGQRYLDELQWESAVQIYSLRGQKNKRQSEQGLLPCSDFVSHRRINYRLSRPERNPLRRSGCRRRRHSQHCVPEQLAESQPGEQWLCIPR